MNNKEKYKKAIDNIKASSRLKEDTMQKIKEKSTRRDFKLVPNIAFVCLIALSVIYVTSQNNTPPISIPEETIPIAKKIDLPTVDTEENLSTIIENINSNTERKMFIEYNGTKSAMQDSAIMEATVKEDLNYDVSNTNVQVQGVDEADIVKTDGKYIYSISDDEIIITDIQNPNEMKKVSSIKYERDETTTYNPIELYVVGNRLVVITSISSLQKTIITDNTVSRYRDIGTIKSITKVFVYDIQNKENPQLQREVEIDGNYLSSRLIQNNFYLITNQYIVTNVEEAEQKYTRPSYMDSCIGNQTKIMEYDSIYYFPETNNSNYLNILTFDVSGENQAKVYSFLGAGSEIYASLENLYIANQKYYRYDTEGKTEIYKFNMNGQEIQYIGTTKFDGRLINQFAMDENDEYFRIAVTNTLQDDTVSNVYVYDKNLNLVGKLEGLAKGESIYSVRFMQNKLYLVTYKAIDPLFVIDLSEASNPKVLGELKIPGVSKYLHPFDENHIIGIGRNTEEKNGNAVDKGMKISLFDVSDVNNPIEKSTIKIGDSRTYSEIEYNHKLLYFDKENSIIGFPIRIQEKSKTISGAVFYHIDLENGINQKAIVEDNGTKKYDNKIQRIIYVGQNTYTISNNTINALNRTNFEKISSLEIR